MTSSYNIPFPSGPNDGDVFFHGELVCTYIADKNTWECRRFTPASSGITIHPQNHVAKHPATDVLVWDVAAQDWVGRGLNLTELHDVVQGVDPSLGETPIWQYPDGHPQDAKWQWGTPNAHIKPWDSTRHWESGATCFYHGRLWRAIAQNTNVEPEIEEGKVTLFIKVKGEASFGLVPMGLSSAEPPSGRIEKTPTMSQYSYWVQYKSDTDITIWKFVIKGLNPATHKPEGEWEGRPWTCLVWRNDVPPPPSPPNFVYVWIYGLPAHTHAPVIGQKIWAAMDFGHHLGAGSDVDAVHPQNHDVLLYDGATRKWKATSLADLKAALDALGPPLPLSPSPSPVPTPNP